MVQLFSSLLPFLPLILAALVICLVLAWVFGRIKLGASLTWLKEHIFNGANLFWVVNLTFMAFSAYHAAPFYASVSTNILGLDWFSPFVGLTAALVLDAVVIVFQNARKQAAYKHDSHNKAIFTFWIAVCCGLNTVANLYNNYEHFNSSNYHSLYDWALAIGPLFMSVFPLIIMGLSSAMEAMSRSKALESMDVKLYQKELETRAKMLEATAEFQDREVMAERKLIELAAKRRENDRLRRGKNGPRRIFFLWAWFSKVSTPEETINVFKAEIQALTTAHAEALQQAKEQFATMQQAYSLEKEELQANIAALILNVEQLKTRRPAPAKKEASGEPQEGSVPTFHFENMYRRNQSTYEQEEGTFHLLRHAAATWGLGDSDAGTRKLRGFCARHPQYWGQSHEANRDDPVNLILASAQDAVRKEFKIKAKVSLLKREA